MFKFVLIALLITRASSGQVNGKAVITGRTVVNGGTTISITPPSLTPSVGATNTQYVTSYTAPSTNPCIWMISENANLIPLIHDVDPTLFPGSNSDARAESYSSGTARTFVIGKRRAERGSDGHWYSRALQTYKTHYFERTCDAVVTTGTFRTDNILLGNTYSDPVPYDTPVGKGYYDMNGFTAWPEFIKWDKTDPTAQAETIIDTQTGLLTKRVAMPNDEPVTYAPPAGPHDFNNVTGSGWTNPSNIMVDDSSSTTFSGTGKDWLFVGDNGYNYGTESLVLAIKGWCSVGACTGTNKDIEACFSINGGATCWPNDTDAKYQNISLGTTANPSTYVELGTVAPILASWTPAGYMPPNYRDNMALLVGYVNVDAGGVVTWSYTTLPNQTFFNPNWLPGTKITIGASLCTITVNTSAISVTVVPANCVPALTVPVTGAAYYSSGFGFKIRKRTTSTDQINLQYATFVTSTSTSLDWPASGSAKRCSDFPVRNTVTGEDGYYCVMLSTGISMLYWIGTTTGTSNYLGFFQIAATGSGVDTFGGICSGGERTFLGTFGTPTASQHFYCSQSDSNTPPKRVIIDCTLNITNQPGTFAPSCVNLTKSSTGKDLIALIVAFTASDTPTFDPNSFGCNIDGRQDFKLVGVCQRSAQDTLAWRFVFDPLRISNDAGCVGGGLPGCIVAMQSSWGHAPARWCVMHTPFVTGQGDYVWTSGKYFDGTYNNLGDGPYKSNITVGSLASATGAIAPGVGACPAGTLSCDTVTVDGPPCDESPQTGEAAISPCSKNSSWVGLQDAVVGDIFTVEFNYGEWLRLAAKTGNVWTLQRGYGNRGTSTHGGTSLSAYCSSQDFSLPYTNWNWVWNTVADPHGANASGTDVVIAWDYSHANPNPTVTLGGNPYWDTANCPVGACYGIRTTGALGDPAQIRVSESPRFAGAKGATEYVERAQDHPSWLQYTALASEKLWFTDGRPLVPQNDISDEFTLVSGQLYVATSTTSDGDNLTLIGGALANLGGLNRKLVPTIGYCGTQPLRDISSATTGNQILDTTADDGKYCIARKVNECRTGSSPGDVYANCSNQFKQSGSTKFTCSGQDQNLFNNLCFMNQVTYLNSVNQMGFGGGNDLTGLYGRGLSKGFGHYKLFNGFWSAQAMPDASWVMYPGFYGILLSKLPPFPAADGIVRTTFVPVPINSLPAVGGADNVIVEFGYAENGDPANRFCTSRQETCIAKDDTVQTIPFQFPSDGTGGVATGITGMSCAAGCSLVLPGISQRMIYYVVKYRASGSGNATIQTNAVKIVNVP